ncbi:hypothetical protein Tco_1222048 [Tanacetum coccineum]
MKESAAYKDLTMILLLESQVKKKMDDDEVNVSEHEDDNDDERTESDNDGDDFVHPKFSTHNEEEAEEESFDLNV